MRQCMKCGGKANVVIRLSDPMCRDCFTSYATHKFRSAFGKSKIIRDQEHVIVAFSAGPSSSAMLHLIQQGLSRRAQKKLRFIPRLVYIDESAVIEKVDSSTQTQSVLQLLEQSKLPYDVLSLSQVMNIASRVGSNDCSAQETSSNMLMRLSLTDDDASLNRLLNAAQTTTAKLNLLKTIRLELLAHIARTRSIHKVLLADTASRLSVGLLSGITQGQGVKLINDISFADDRFGDVCLIRPMREFTAKEVSLYNYYNDVTTIFFPNLSTKSVYNMESLAEDFVSGLQAQYPNTVSTIFRTGEKFDSTSLSVTNRMKCCLCQCVLDTEVTESSSLSSTRFSKTLCTEMAAQTLENRALPSVDSHERPCQPTGTDMPCQPTGTDMPCQPTGTVMPCQPTGTDMQEHTRNTDWAAVLCYGCQLVCSDMTSLTDLPVFVTSSATEMRNNQLDRTQMREVIKQYLLEG